MALPPPESFVRFEGLPASGRSMSPSESKLEGESSSWYGWEDGARGKIVNTMLGCQPLALCLFRESEKFIDRGPCKHYIILYTFLY